MKRTLLVSSLIFLCAFSFAQSSHKFSLDWRDGIVVFKSGDSLRCDLRFNQTGVEPILHIRENNQLLTLPPHDVKSFSFYDPSRERTRIFSAFPDTQGGSKEIFMESIFHGREFAILNQKTMERPHNWLNMSSFMSKPVRMFKKYILNRSTGEILPLSRGNAMLVLEGHKDEIQAYIKANDLRFKKVKDFIEVFAYSESLH